MELLNIGQSLVHLRFAVSLTQLYSLIPLPHVVVEGTDVEFVAPVLVTHYPLVLVWVVESLHGSMTFIAQQSFGALVPAKPIYQSFTILRGVLKELWWPSEVSCVVGVVAALRVVRILFSGTPARLVVEHKEHVPFFLII